MFLVLQLGATARQETNKAGSKAVPPLIILALVSSSVGAAATHPRPREWPYLHRCPTGSKLRKTGKNRRQKHLSRAASRRWKHAAAHYTGRQRTGAGKRAEIALKLRTVEPLLRRIFLLLNQSTAGKPCCALIGWETQKDERAMTVLRLRSAGNCNTFVNTAKELTAEGI